MLHIKLEFISYIELVFKLLLLILALFIMVLFIILLFIIVLVNLSTFRFFLLKEANLLTLIFNSLLLAIFWMILVLKFLTDF